MNKEQRTEQRTKEKSRERREDEKNGRRVGVDGQHVVGTQRLIKPGIHVGRTTRLWTPWTMSKVGVGAHQDVVVDGLRDGGNGDGNQRLR